MGEPTRRATDGQSRLLAGVGAIVMFGTIAGAVYGSPFDDAVGFSGEAVIEGVGLALVNAPTDLATIGFVVPLVLLAIVLDAAVDGAIYLARRETDEETT